MSNLTVLENQQVPAQIETANMLMNEQTMTRLFRFAETMAAGTVTVPKHLQGKPADCLAVAMQAAQWGMNPFAVAQKTHLVNGTLGYEAQLVNAIIQSSGAITGTFYYEYTGEGQRMACRVGAVLRGTQEVTWGEWLCIADVKVQNSPLWKTNPKQQMGYLQVKNWSRAYAPGAILGVYTNDELAEMPTEREINPTPSRTQPVKSSLKARQAKPEPVADVTPELEADPFADHSVDGPQTLSPAVEALLNILPDCTERCDLERWKTDVAAQFQKNSSEYVFLVGEYTKHVTALKAKYEAKQGV